MSIFVDKKVLRQNYMDATAVERGIMLSGKLPREIENGGWKELDGSGRRNI